MFILVDDLGWTDLGVYGSDFYQSSNVDKLASQGILFTNAYTASNVCSPTRASIMTGKYPATLDLTDYIPGRNFPEAKLAPPDWKKYLDTKELTIAEVFKANNYKTAHIGKWHLGEEEFYWPEHQGFDMNVGGYSRGAPIKNKAKGKNGYFSPYGNPRLEDGADGEYLTHRLASEAVTFINKNKDSPFFLNLWFYSVHMPLQARQDKINKYQSLLKEGQKHNNPTYAAMVEHMDDAVGTILKTLKSLDLDKNTIIVFTSDNGGLVGNHKRFKEKITSNFPLRSGKGDRYEGGVRVPCILYFPEKLKPRVEETPITSPDFFPTLIDLAGLIVEKEPEIDGVSLSDLLLENKKLEKRALYWHYPHYHLEGAVPYSAVQFDNYKLIHNLETDSLELYNLKKDISETTDLSAVETGKTDSLFTRLRKWKEAVKAQSPTMNHN
ncbi:MAG: sulfatase [Nonlabens sp.]